MRFKATKIATAVAAGLGVSLAGMSTASADAILFPYFAVSDTVTSIVTTINLAKQGSTSAVAPQTLHYRFYYKSGANAESLTAACEEFDVRRITSPNDIATFDLIGRYGDDLGIIAEPAELQQKANYTGVGQSFALMDGLTPARGFLLVDNDEAVNSPFEPSLYGEIAVVDFAGGAIWGYQAYNAAPVVPDSSVGSTAALNFEDSAEKFGEVLAGTRAITATSTRGGASPPIPVGIMPIASDTAPDAVITKFFVTPIGHAISLPNGTVTGRQGQDSGTLTSRIRLQVSYDSSTPNDVIFDRDENPISGQAPKSVTCVGAVQASDLLSAGALREVEQYGGWSGVEIDSPGPLGTFNEATGAFTARTNNTNQAVVIKLEYNPAGQFLGEGFAGSFNNAMWLRYGYRESIATTSSVPGAVAPRLSLSSALSAAGPVDVAEDFEGSAISVLQ